MVHLAILTHSLPCTTFADGGLDFRVRDGIGYFPTAIDTPKLNFKSLLLQIRSLLNQPVITSTFTKQNQITKQTQYKIKVKRKTTI